LVMLELRGALSRKQVRRRRHSRGTGRRVQPFGIGVSILCPGVVRTNILENARNRPERYGPPTPVDTANPVYASFAELGQRPIPRQAQVPGGPRRGPGTALHGLSCGDPAQPGAQALLPPSARARQTRSPGPRRPHAQTADDPQFHAADSASLGICPELSAEAMAASRRRLGRDKRPP